MPYSKSAEIVMLLGLARRTARKSRKYRYFTLDVHVGMLSHVQKPHKGRLANARHADVHFLDGLRRHVAELDQPPIRIGLAGRGCAREKRQRQFFRGVGLGVVDLERGLAHDAPRGQLGANAAALGLSGGVGVGGRGRGFTVEYCGLTEPRVSPTKDMRKPVGPSPLKWKPQSWTLNHGSAVLASR